MSAISRWINSFSVKVWTPAVLSWFIVLATFSVYGQLLTFGTAAGLDDIVLGRILGTLDTSFGIVLAYWLGTSRSSHDKDQTISDMAKNK